MRLSQPNLNVLPGKLGVTGLQSPNITPLTIHRSRNLINPFKVHRPETTVEAVDMKRQFGENGVYMAGGIDVVNRLKMGLHVKNLIHLPSVKDLDVISEINNFLLIGFLATHFDFENWLSRRHNIFPSLSATWRKVGNIRVRFKGTLAGNIMSHNPNYDVSPVFGALKAKLIFDCATNSQSVESLQSYRNQTVSEDGLLRAIKIPLVPGRELTYDRSMRPIISVALAVDRQDDFIVGGRVGFGCAFDQPVSIRLPISEPIHVTHLTDAAEHLAADVVGATPAARTDYLGSSAYRKRMAQVLLRRQLIHLAPFQNAG